jgi:hypothetical protein
MLLDAVVFGLFFTILLCTLAILLSFFALNASKFTETSLDPQPSIIYEDFFPACGGIKFFQVFAYAIIGLLIIRLWVHVGCHPSL